MSATTCRGCGLPVNAGLSFCPNCGVSVGATAGGVPSSPPTAEVVVQPSMSAQQSSPVIQGFQPQSAQPVAYAQPAPVQPYVAQPSYPPQPYQPPSYPPQQEKRNETRRAVLVGVSVLLLTLIVRVAFAAANPKPDGELVAELPVGPAGGSVEFGDGGKLTVPKGALVKQETIQIRRKLQREQIRGVSPGGGAPLVIPAGTVFVYFLSPIDIQLLRPVILTLPALAGPGAGLVFVSTNGGVTFIQGTQRGRNVTVVLNSFNFSQGQQVFVNRR